MSQMDTDRTKRFKGMKEWSPAIKEMDSAFEPLTSPKDETGEMGSNKTTDVVN